MIVGVDFDGTLCSENFPEIGKQKLIHKLILWWIKRRQRKGDTIILVTCREGFYLTEALSFLALKGLFFPNFANENASWLVKEYGDCRKIAVDRMVDDKNVGFLGWLLRKFK